MTQPSATTEGASLSTLVDHCDALLDAAAFSDYCPNGLQVDPCRGSDLLVRRLITGVTASQAMIDAAADARADVLMVHHGFFWKSEDPRIVGLKARRIAALVRAGIALVAYHLPLDAHPELGNNRQLAQVLGIAAPRPLDAAGSLLWCGELPAPLSGDALAAAVSRALGREPLHIHVLERPIRTIAWCTGAAQGQIEQAAAAGVDAYLSGEVSEQTTHLARELGLDYFGAGHHATERYGVQALGAHLARTFGIDHRFIDLPNPV
jgi:dinuclear metal center YbgI/SA1388 family protein